MVLVFLHISQVYQDVVKVDNTELVEEFTQYIIHEVLDCCRCIGQSERYNEKFKELIAAAECCFLLITFLYADLVEVIAEVDFGEVSSPLDLVQGFFHAGQGISIFFSNIIKGPVVYKHMWIRSWFLTMINSEAANKVEAQMKD